MLPDFNIPAQNDATRLDIPQPYRTRPQPSELGFVRTARSPVRLTQISLDGSEEYARALGEILSRAFQLELSSLPKQPDISSLLKRMDHAILKGFRLSPELETAFAQTRGLSLPELRALPLPEGRMNVILTRSLNVQLGEHALFNKYAMPALPKVDPTIMAELLAKLKNS